MSKVDQALKTRKKKEEIKNLLNELLLGHRDCIQALRAAENYGHTHPDAWRKGEEMRESFANIRESVEQRLLKLVEE